MSPRFPVWVALGKYVTEAPDHFFAQARGAQVPAGAWRAAWMARHAAARPGPADGTAARAEGDMAMLGPVQVQAEADGAATAGGTVQTAEAKLGAQPKPVPPLLTYEQREAARLKALELTADRKAIRGQLQAGQITLAQVLAGDDPAARGMRVTTVLLALPGIGAASAGRLMAAAGVDRGRRAGALTAGQRERLVSVHADLAARRDRRT